MFSYNQSETPVENVFVGFDNDHSYGALLSGDRVIMSYRDDTTDGHLMYLYVTGEAAWCPYLPYVHTHTHSRFECTPPPFEQLPRQ